MSPACATKLAERRVKDKGRHRMAEMVGSAVVQEVVTGAFSFMRNNHEEIASQSHLIERLKFAHLDLKFALERTKRMPIIEMSLLQRRMMIKHAFEESRDLLYKQHTLRVNREDEGAEKQEVTLCPSLPKRVMHAVKHFFSTENGSISGSCVGRFELFAEKTDKFVRDVESGFSLAFYRFSCPLITQLLEGKYMDYQMVSGSQTRTLSIHPSFLEDHGAVAYLMFDFKDLETPVKCFRLRLMLRLSESTGIVGISTKFLQTLEPQFKSAADLASGELAQISTEISVFQPGPALRETVFEIATNLSTWYRQEPLCCIGDGLQPCAKNILSSELTKRFPEQVNYLFFERFISAAEYNLQNSTVETNRNIIKAWPILQLSVTFLPHYLVKIQDGEVRTYVFTSPGVQEVSTPLDCLGLSKMAKFVLEQAVDCFKLEPGRTAYRVLSYSAHGLAEFTVSKPTTEMGCAPKIGHGSKTRRTSKRKR